MRINGVAAAIMTIALSSCAVEGVGWQGRVDAYNNAAEAGREFADLNRGERDAAWYAGWCSAIEPHFKLMSTVHERVDKYCTQMQRQPENAAAIQQSLVATLNASKSSATDSRNAAYAAFGASAQAQQPKQVHCTAVQYGNATSTDCRQSSAF
jgi:hypothetical protein